MDEDAWNADELIERLEHANRRSRRRTALISVVVATIFLAVAFQGVLKKAYFAYTWDIPFNSYDNAVANMEMWKKNAACTRGPDNWTHQRNGSKIAVNVCPSGDIFIHYVSADDRGFYRWVSADSLSRGEF